MRVGLKPKEVTALLRERGFKVTPQRLAVYNALAHTTEHPSAEALYQELLARLSHHESGYGLQVVEYFVRGRAGAGTQCGGGCFSLRCQSKPASAYPLHALRSGR